MLRLLLKKSIFSFINYLQNVQHFSPHTIRAYSSDLGRFVSYIEAIQLRRHIKSQLIDRQILREYLSFLHEKGLSKRSIHRAFAALSSLFTYLTEHLILSKNPIDTIDLPKQEKKIPDTITRDMVEILLTLPNLSSYLGVRDQAILELLYSTGIRVGELASLNKEHLHEGRRTIKVSGKRGKERIMPVTQTAWKAIMRYITHPKYNRNVQALFLNGRGSRLTIRSIDRILLGYWKESGFTHKITPHTLRHSIATHWLERGMNLKDIQSLLGHSSMMTTTIYTKVGQSLQKTTYDECHPFGKQKREQEEQ